MATAGPVRTLIVDDEPLARRRLRTLLAGEQDIEIVGEAGSGNAAVRAIGEKKPDLLLLDIQMPGKGGFEVLEEIAGVHQPIVVFVTAHDEHAIQAFEVEAVDYVLKPVVEDRLRAAVRRAIARRREQSRADLTAAMAALLERVQAGAEAARIPVKSDGRVTFVPAGEIDWVKADRDLVTLYTRRGTHVMRATMTEIESRLGKQRFVRLHRSAIVSVSSIREIQPWFKGDYVVVLNDGTRIRTGRTYRGAVQALMRNNA